jgi:hypothetical protein
MSQLKQVIKNKKRIFFNVIFNLNNAKFTQIIC